jgi:hypothetical protein
MDDGAGNITESPIDYTPNGRHVELPQNQRFKVVLTEIVYEIFQTQTDNRVTAGCRALHGGVHRVGTRPYPPIHPGCRCYRVYHHSEWVSRDYVSGGRVMDI